jgi:hypothetical protein
MTDDRRFDQGSRVSAYAAEGRYGATSPERASREGGQEFKG